MNQARRAPPPPPPMMPGCPPFPRGDAHLGARGPGQRAFVDPGRTYHTGAKKPAFVSAAAERVLAWCLPPYYRAYDLGAQTIEVTLGVAPPAGGIQASDDLSDLAFQIRWGSGENCGPDDPVVEMDAINGTTVALVAYGIEVFYLYPPTTLPGVTQPTVDVTVSVGIGARSGVGVTDPVRRTVKIGVLPPASISASLLIPRFAVSAVMQNSTGTVPSLVLNQQTGQLGPTFSVAPLGKLDQDSVPVANGARAFSLGNPGAVQSNSTAVIFYLAP